MLIVSKAEKTPPSALNWHRKGQPPYTEFLAGRQKYGNNLSKGAPCTYCAATVEWPDQSKQMICQAVGAA